MGDILHALPAVAALRERHPDWHIGWAVEPRWCELFQTSADFDEHLFSVGRSERMPLIDRWYQVPTRLWREHPFSLSTLSDIRSTRLELRGERFDLAVDLQGSLKSAAIGRMADAKNFVGPVDPREGPAKYLYRTRIPTNALHVVDQACEILGGAIGELLQPAPITLPADPTAELWADRIARPFILLAPTAGWRAKEWPAERFGVVAAHLGRLGYRVLVNETLGNRDADVVIGASQGHATLVPSSVAQLIALTRRASLVLAGDTGPLHLAAALGRPVVGLYGPTDPDRTGPWNTPSRVLRHPGSVTSHGRNAPTDPGLRQLTVEEVLGAVLSLLKETSAETSAESSAESSPQTTPQTGAPA